MQPLPLNFPQDCLPERRLLSQLLPFAGAGGSGAQSVSYRTYADSLNPPILHRKELMLPADHPRRTEYEALTCAAQAVGLFDEPRRIGYRRQWLALVREQSYRIEGHALVPLGNDETNLTAAAEPRPMHAGWQASRQLTALVRYGFSAPVQSLARYGFLDGRYRFFDYGCGRGDDVRGLTENGLTAAGWDPYHAPDNPIRAAHIVNLGFVIMRNSVFWSIVIAVREIGCVTRRRAGLSESVLPPGIASRKSMMPIATPWIGSGSNG